MSVFLNSISAKRLNGGDMVEPGAFDSFVELSGGGVASCTGALNLYSGNWLESSRDSRFRIVLRNAEGAFGGALASSLSMSTSRLPSTRCCSDRVLGGVGGSVNGYGIMSTNNHIH